jgi:hypothetical protein
MGVWRAAWSAVVDAVTPPRMTLQLPPAEHQFDTAPRPIDMLLSAMRNGQTTTVSRDDALSVAAVARARNELCAISTLPLRLYKGLSAVDSPLFRQFDIDVPNVVHMSMTIEDLAFDQIAWWQITSQDFYGYPMSVRRVDPCKVTLDQPGKGSGPNSTIVGVQPLYDPAPAPPAGRWVWIDRDDGKGPQPFPAKLMIRFDSPNPGILRSLARMIRIAILLDRLIEMYADNPTLKELFTDSPDTDEPYNDAEADAFVAEWAALRKMMPVGWLPNQVQRVDVNAPSPKDLTLVELRQEVNLAIANGLGVDPEDLGVSTTSRTYQNAVDRKQDKINRTYSPYMSALIDRLGMGDVTMRGYTPRFDLADYLKSDPVTQAAYWNALKGMGVVDAEWIGEQAGIDPAVTARAGKSAAAAPVDAQPAAPGVAARRPHSAVRFDNSGAAWTFNAGDFEEPPAAPTVDTEARTITGLAVPYGSIANKYGMKITFDAGSLEYSDPARMAVLKDHVTPVGFHRSITDTAAGPVVELAVLDAPEGTPAKGERDQLLYDAANGLYSGLSIGVDNSFDPADGDGYEDDDGVWHVTRATWRETTSTYMPAFDDARVTRVAASRTGGSPMEPCPHCGQRHAPGIACATFAAHTATQTATPTPVVPPAPVSPAPAGAAVPQLTPEQWAAFSAAFPAAPPALPAAPTQVSAHHGPAQVNEPLPYRYDRHGNLRAAQHDFSHDIAVAYNPNYQGGEPKDAADNRIKAWLQYAFGDGDGPRNLGKLAAPGDAAAQQFAITPANVVNLNYPQNRPEMYVDQLDFLYPMYEAFNKGTLDAVTPFVLPKFNASSGLVTDHVSGTEPTPGAFTATAQTITPSALSGKVEILREVFDQGGNPQASGLIWRQIVRGWYEGIEAAIQAFFVANAASIPDIALGTAVTDAAMDQALASAITALQYIRGGDRFSKVFTQIDLYQKLGKAVDTTNRPLYPTFGAMNTSGSMAPDQNYLNVRGKTFAPAWATAATGSVAASSWMMDPDVVGVWLSTPQRLDIVWRVAWVDMGVFGYKALAITDFTRTRELIYDPV